MADGAQGVFDALYRRLILRDAFGKIAPGLLVLFGLEAHGPLNALIPGTSVTAEVLRALLLVGAAWFVALGLQALGEWSRVLCMWPREMGDDALRYAKRIAFGRLATEDEKQQAERFALIGEASGVMAVACLVAAAQSVIASMVTRAPGAFFSDPAGWLWRLGLGMLALALLRVHHGHCRKRYRYITRVLELAGNENGSAAPRVVATVVPPVPPKTA